jgi:hypothetical protein
MALFAQRFAASANIAATTAQRRLQHIVAAYAQPSTQAQPPFFNGLGRFWDSQRHLSGPRPLRPD